ncbi:adenosylcobinamide-GDP ribazoletransferase [Thalassospira alkalitolerans]|uniref:adenosylcobinamide-GDP ribazoletransferase n=1 Tax=Thalassospira alkalitolerans TaxID=1293890 RepID=UPI003AA7D866
MNNNHKQSATKSQSPDASACDQRPPIDDGKIPVNGLLDDFWRALALLSRIPVSMRCDFRPEAITRSVWCWPFVGLFIAGVAIIPAFLTDILIGNSAVTAIMATLVLVLLTGAMHEDGIADCADGFGGGQDRQRKLEIMRDSRIGTYGVIALVLCLALRIVLLSLASDSGSMAAILIVMAVTSRAAIPVVMHFLDPARMDGLGKGAGRPELLMVVGGIGVALLLVLVVAGPMAVITSVMAMMVAVVLVGWIAKSQIGGHTGDVLGMTQIASELFVGIAFVAVIQGT